MSYFEVIKTEEQAGLWGKSEEVKAMVKAALAEGKEVKFEHSSFSDPGPDWSKILIDGKCIDYTPGY